MDAITFEDFSDATKVIIPRATLRTALPRLGSYQEDVIERGHRPLVLSGMNLIGKAKKYAFRYQCSRDNVMAAIARLTGGRITAEIVPVCTASGVVRRCKVWYDTHANKRARIFIAD